LSIRLLAFGTAGLLLLAALGFLVVALHVTFVRLTDDVTAPLLVAATLATAAAIVLLVMWLIRRGANPERERGERKDGADELLSLVGQMSEAIANKTVPPLTVVGLALATGLAQGLRK
jgi:membrane protein implicated in regulation of membrane protease activity